MELRDWPGKTARPRSSGAPAPAAQLALGPAVDEGSRWRGEPPQRGGTDNWAPGPLVSGHEMSGMKCRAEAAEATVPTSVRQCRNPQRGRPREERSGGLCIALQGPVGPSIERRSASRGQLPRPAERWDERTSLPLADPRLFTFSSPSPFRRRDPKPRGAFPRSPGLR
jgi:hypothetical protein